MVKRNAQKALFPIRNRPLEGLLCGEKHATTTCHGDIANMPAHENAPSICHKLSLQYAVMRK